ncbi:uncharacterized protein LOC112590788 isoform X2 [Harpegnathos saltator]|uniref:uncharacterized protein LOC112590788 isoform X2 n=1 Tax=Harpegnathos saltator TaxID=610380 RepID=UPI000DBEDA5E|nr:uncharacterized protein LOC112590788 isoform X2 [Harpegnathos saltator]
MNVKMYKEKTVEFLSLILLDKWTTAIKNKIHCPITTSSIIWERHFKKEFLSGRERKRLKINAIPTEFLMLQTDPLKELNNLINLYGHVNTDSREVIVAIAAGSTMCSMDENIAPDLTDSREVIVATAAGSTMCSMDENIALDLTDSREVTVATAVGPTICSMDENIVPDLTEERTVGKDANFNMDVHIVSDPAEDKPHNLLLQIETLKAENECLTALMESLKNDRKKQLENVADTYQRLLQEQKKLMKNKLTSALNKVNLN